MKVNELLDDNLKAKLRNAKKVTHEDNLEALKQLKTKLLKVRNGLDPNTYKAAISNIDKEVDTIDAFTMSYKEYGAAELAALIGKVDQNADVIVPRNHRHLAEEDMGFYLDRLSQSLSNLTSFMKNIG